MLLLRQFPAFFTLLICLGLHSCIPDVEEAARLEARLNDQIEIAHGITTYYSDSALVRVVLKAPTMENLLDPKDPRKLFPDGLRVTFIDEFGDTTSVLTAKDGVYRERQNQVVVRDSVVWQSTEGQKLETDELTWQDDEERIHTDRFVVITQPDFIIYGYGLEAKQDFSDAKVNQVVGRVPVTRPRDGQPSDGATSNIPPR
ncbi:LPS export ABC transporter periplasmic protein LptC [Lewinellaceae bacterium SD302]|nr:LPS export ABC transporter periplasmic protein LptC [Lewinellaceae bacterium SD302]